jgi:predicted acylesterase/phospholipase RssA
MDKVPPMENMVLSGAGMKGIAYFGVIQYMEEHGLFRDLKRVLGVSIGAITAMFFAIKLKAKQARDLIVKLSVDDITEFKMNDIRIENILNIFKNLSLDSGKRLQSVIRACIKVKLGNADATFRDLHEYNPDLEMIVLGTELTKLERVYFSYKTTPDFPVWKAVSMSICIPFYTKPILDDGKIYVDGGLTCNYPIDYFNDDIERTVGIVFESTDNSIIKYNTLPDFFVYIKLILQSALFSLQNHLHRRYNDSTFVIRVGTDNMVQFDITEDTKLQYIECGYKSFEEHWKKRIQRYTMDTLETGKIYPKVNDSSIQTKDEIQESNDIQFEIESMK